MADLLLSKLENDILLKDQETTFFKTDFNFLKEHNGWRPGAFHLLISPTGQGKSTFTRSIIWDLAINNSGTVIGVYLSEESEDDFKTEFAKLGMTRDLTTCTIRVISEKDEGNIDWLRLSEWVSNLDFLLFDNLTTSRNYNNKPNAVQFDFALKLSKLASDFKIPVVGIAHTDGDAKTKNNLIEENHIRGDKSISSLSQFMYALQRFYVKDSEGKERFFSVLRLLKFRGFSPDNLVFQMVYNKKTASFQQDKVIPWNDFKQAYDQRLRLAA